MAVLKLSHGWVLQRLVRSSHDTRSSKDAEVRRLERRYRESIEAADKWTALLRDLEQQGQTADAGYERYFQAYLDAKRQLKRAEMDLFNVRHIGTK